MTPIQLHPDNRHIFLFRGKPTLLITSAEHYGALLNLDFDYAKYLEQLAADGMNHTRVFSGAYCEPMGAFKIARNSLAPEPGRFLTPWARSDEEGYANGGNRFDLTLWSDAYFERLHDLMSVASEHGIVVEMNLFCPFYKDEMWDLCPLNAQNNVNGVGEGPYDTVYRAEREAGMREVQEALVRKLVEELKDYDNLYFEVMNEPYARGVERAWEHTVVDVIAAAEADRTTKHLISLNVANGKELVDEPNPKVSILNFHYAWPPETVAMNYPVDRVIGDNETGFRGTGDAYYRREAWAFILAGGGLYNNLDYSFVAGHEDGTFAYPDDQPGGGSHELRQQLKILSDFVHGFDLVRARPMVDVTDGLPDGISSFVMGIEGQEYAVYVCRTDDMLAIEATPTAHVVKLTMPAGVYRAEWVDVLWGEKQSVQMDHAGGKLELATPGFVNDIAVGVRRVG